MRDPAGDVTPELAAVVCTHNRADLLAATLDSLRQQSLNPQAFEVIVIDDGCTDGTPGVIADYASALPIRGVRQRHAGLGSAKNHGLFVARAPVVLFLDDDDVADRDLLARHLDAHRQDPSDSVAVLGYTALDAALRCDPLMHFVTEIGCQLFSYPGIQDRAGLDFTYFWGGRTSCKRAFLLRHGVFDPRFHFGCEDIELGFRLSKYGLSVRYRADAVLTMTRGMTLEQFCRRLQRQGQSNAAFSRLHTAPEVQRWTEVIGARESWAALAPTADAVLRRAISADAMVRMKLKAGFELSPDDTATLHHLYAQVFNLYKVKGIVEGLNLA